MSAPNAKIYNNYFIDPETLIKKSEIINHRKFDEINKYENDAIIQIDSDSDTENSSNSFELENEAVIKKPEVTLEVLKEVPHDDKENIQSKKFDEFGKRPRGRPKENKPKTITFKKYNDELNINEPSTAPKTFNISLDFLSFKSKTSLFKSKKAAHQQKNLKTKQSKLIHRNKLKKNTRKRGRPRQKKLANNNQSSNNINKTENSLIQNQNETIIKSDNEEIMPSLNSENSINQIKENSEINTTTNNTKLPVKRKRGRPFGTFKVKKQQIVNNKKIPRQKGRPLSNVVVEIPPKKRGRPFARNAILIKKKYDKPGRPSLGLKKLKKYDKPGRPPGPPKPIKIPGKRGRKPNPDLPQKKPKIPGRGRGRPSFASLKENTFNNVQLSDTDEQNSLKEEEPEKTITKESDKNLFKEESHKNLFIEESDKNLFIEESDKNIFKDKNDIKNNSYINQGSFTQENVIINNLPILSEKIHNENDIETISLASTDSNLEYDDKEILNIDNSDEDDNDDDDDNSDVGICEENEYYNATESNFSKVEVKLDYMFHEKKAILQNHYI